MKKFILLLILVGLASVNNFGQEKYPTKEEFDSAIKKSLEKAEKITYRITDISMTYDNKTLEETTTQITENLPPNKMRNVITTIDSNGKVTEKMVFIRIGNTEYTKTNDESWKKRENSKGGPSGVVIGKVGNSSDIKELNQYIIVPDLLENKKTEIYFNCQVLLFAKTFIFFEQRDWISADGLIIKSTSSQRNITPDNIVSVGTRTYEYNPKDLKIEAPIK